MQAALLIGIGGAIGSVARYGLGELRARWLGAGFPYGTLAANILGSMLIGMLAGLLGVDGRPLLPMPLRLLLMTGFCGGFTTFSAFSLQTMELIQGGSWERAALYVLASLVTCLLGVWAGWTLALAINSSRGLV